MSLNVLILVSLGILAFPGDAPDVRPAYEAAASQAGRDPDAHAKLALWCEAHGLDTERVKHLSMAVVTDPSHALARGLLGLVQDGQKWRRPEQIVDHNAGDPQRAALLEEYHAKRSAAGNTADAQVKLAEWCASRGLTLESQAHYAMALRLDPDRADVWKKLGYSKHKGQWRTDTQIAAEKAEAKAQEAADRRWSKQLQTWKGMLGQGEGRRREAEAGLLALDDPRAVPSILKTFAKTDPSLAVRLLGQIDAASASQALATAAVFAKSEEVRRAAAETLTQRDPREYAGYLVSLIRDPLRYEVRPVGGPGSPGELWVEGKKADLKRIYAPPPPPQVALLPGDMLGYDEFGLPVIHRMWVEQTRVRISRELAVDWAGPPQPNRALARQLANVPGAESLAHFVARTPASPLGGEPLSMTDWERRFITSKPGPYSTYYLDGAVPFDYQIPIGQAVVEAQRAAARAQGQLGQDVAAIEAYNAPIITLNDRVRPLLMTAAGRDVGPKREDWETWWVDQIGYASLRDPNYKPTIIQNVPVAYNPPSPVLQSGPFIPTAVRRVSCFAAGTLVWTPDGLRPIESLNVGDRVLSQDANTGAQSYQPVLVVHRNPPSPTLAVAFEGGESVTASTYHRFWKAGHGWVMARELKPGDVLRTQSGLTRVDRISEAPVQPVFNLDVASSHSFFVGTQGALVHDNSLPDTRLSPFDRIPEIAQATP